MIKKKYGTKETGDFALVAEPADGASVAGGVDVTTAAEAADTALEAIEASDAAAVRAAEAERGRIIGGTARDVASYRRLP